MESILNTFDLNPIDPLMILVGAGLFVTFWWAVSRGFFGAFQSVYEARLASSTGAEDSAKDLADQAVRMVADINRELELKRIEALTKREARLAEARREASQIVDAGQNEAEELLRKSRWELMSIKGNFVAQAEKDSIAMADSLVQRVLN